MNCDKARKESRVFVLLCRYAHKELDISTENMLPMQIAYLTPVKD